MAKSKALKFFKTLLGWLIFLTLVGVPAAYFYLQEPIIDVTVTTLKRGHVEETVAAISAGTVEPKQSSMVSAETIGKDITIPVEEGMRVKKGDVLAELDSTQQGYQVEQAQVRLEQTEVALRLLKQQFGNDLERIKTLKRTRDIAADEFGRDKSLYEQKDVGSQSMVNLSEVQFNQMDDTYIALNNLLGLYPLRIEEAETGLRAIEIMKKQAATALNWTQVRAPFDGIVAKIYMEVGESVGSGLGGDMGGGSALSMGGGLAGAGGLGGAGMGGMSMPSPMAVAHIVDDSDIYVKAPFDEANFGRIQIGDKVRGTVDTYRGEEFPGKVSYIAPIVSKNMDLSRTFEVEILIEQGKDKLITGMSADVIVIAEEKENVLLVPAEALIREEEGYVVKDGRAEKRMITVGIGNWLVREVLDGIKEGETLITSIALKELKDGCKINVVESLEAQ